MSSLKRFSFSDLSRRTTNRQLVIFFVEIKLAWNVLAVPGKGRVLCQLPTSGIEKPIAFMAGLGNGQRDTDFLVYRPYLIAIERHVIPEKCQVQ